MNDDRVLSAEQVGEVWDEVLDAASEEWFSDPTSANFPKLDAFVNSYATLASRCAALEAALAQAIQVIEWCGQNDKTPRYDYQGESAKRRDGKTAGPGKAFNTPREFARYWPDVLRATLTPVPAEAETTTPGSR